MPPPLLRPIVDRIGNAFFGYRWPQKNEAIGRWRWLLSCASKAWSPRGRVVNGVTAAARNARCDWSSLLPPRLLLPESSRVCLRRQHPRRQPSWVRLREGLLTGQLLRSCAVHHRVCLCQVFPSVSSLWWYSSCMVRTDLVWSMPRISVSSASTRSRNSVLFYPCLGQDYVSHCPPPAPRPA